MGTPDQDRQTLARLRAAYRDAAPGYRRAAYHRLRTHLHEMLRDEVEGHRPRKGGEPHEAEEGRGQAGLLTQLALSL